MILIGHHCMMSGSVKFALGEYMRALRKMPNDPLLHLLIGNAYLAHVSACVCVCVCVKMPNDPLLHLLIGNAYLAHVCVCVCVCVPVRIYIFIYVHISIYIYIYIYMHIQRSLRKCRV